MCAQKNKFKYMLTTLLFPPSTSILFPITTNGKFSGSEGLACMSLTSSVSTKFKLHYYIKRESLGSLQEDPQKMYLNKELFPPIVEVVKRFHRIHIIDKNTAISTTIESNTKALKSFLTSCVPDLPKQMNMD